MALTTAEKTSIRRHLGYNVASAALYPFVDVYTSVDQVLSTLPADSETQAREILTRLTSIETTLASMTPAANVAALGPISFNDGLTPIWRELKRWRRELSSLLGVPLLDGGDGLRIVVT